MEPRLSPRAPEMPGSTGSRVFRAALPGGPDSELQLSARGWELHPQHLPLSRSGLEKEEAGSRPQGRRRAEHAPPPLALHSGQSGQFSLGAPGDLGETPLRDLSGEGCTVSAHPRRSGALLRQESMLGTREGRRAPGAGDRAAGARLPFGEAGNNHARGLPGAAGHCQLDPAGGGSARGGACPGDLSRPGRSLLGALPPPAGNKRRHARGRRPRAGPEAGRRGCLVLVVAPSARHCAPRQTATQEPRNREGAPCPPQEPATAAAANKLPLRPVPRPHLWRARPGRTPPPQPDSRVLRSRYPPFQAPPTPKLPSCRQPLAKAPHTPPARPSEAGTASSPRSSSPALSSCRTQGSRRRRGGTHPLSRALPRAAPGRGSVRPSPSRSCQCGDRSLLRTTASLHPAPRLLPRGGA